MQLVVMSAQPQSRLKQEWSNVFACVPVKELVDIILYDFLNRLIFEYNFPTLCRPTTPAYKIAKKLYPSFNLIIHSELFSNVIMYRSIGCYFNSQHKGKSLLCATVTKVARGKHGCKITLQFVGDPMLYEFGQFDAVNDNQMLSAILRLSKNVNLCNLPSIPAPSNPHRSLPRRDCYWCGSNDHFVTYEDDHYRTNQSCSFCGCNYILTY